MLLQDSPWDDAPNRFPDRHAASSQADDFSKDDWLQDTQDLVDSLPKAWSRGLLYTLATFSITVLPWAALSKVDQTGTARGRLEPKDKLTRLDSPVSGTVKHIPVRKGQFVKKGQPLLELDSDLIRNDLQQEIAKLEGLQNRVNQTRLIKSQIQSSTRTQRLQTQAQANEQLEQMNQIQQRIALSQSTSKLAQQRFSIAQKNVARFTDLQQQGVVPKNITEEKLQAALESQELLEKTESEIQQAQSELKKQKSTYDRVTYTGKLTLQESEKQLEELNAQLLDLQTEIKQTAKQIQALQLQRYQRIVRAPANGTIFDLEIEKPGAVVQTSQAIAQIAPAKTPLILRAQMPSQESGFLKLGMPVKLKFDAYSFQDYGVVEGRLSWVAPTSRSIQTAQGAIEVFDIEVTLDRPYLQHQGRKIPMTAGQTASAEVIVRQRRVIDFILDPFKKLQNGGLEL